MGTDTPLASSESESEAASTPAFGVGERHFVGCVCGLEVAGFGSEGGMWVCVVVVCGRGSVVKVEDGGDRVTVLGVQVGGGGGPRRRGRRRLVDHGALSIYSICVRDPAAESTTDRSALVGGRGWWRITFRYTWPLVGGEQLIALGEICEWLCWRVWSGI